MSEANEPHALLGAFLRDRRARLNPAELGFPAARRRTPGLRREEVAMRASISPNWYTWLEQGRGGPPSPEVLNRLASALMLTEVEREYLFLLGLGHPPDVVPGSPQSVPPRLQRVLDAMDASPAILRTAAWDVVAWNRAAALVLTDYAKLAPAQRNVLRLVFLDPAIRAAQLDWASMAGFVVSAFRADTMRAGMTPDVQRLIDELCTSSAEFAEMWRDNDVGRHSEGVKRLRHATLGVIGLEFSGFSVAGRADLGMIVFNPTSDDDSARIRALVASPPSA